MEFKKIKISIILALLLVHVGVIYFYAILNGPPGFAWIPKRESHQGKQKKKKNVLGIKSVTSCITGNVIFS